MNLMKSPLPTYISVHVCKAGIDNGFQPMQVRETEEQRDRQRKENLELKRGMNDEVHEKQTLAKANEQLRGQVKKAEQERIALKVFFQSNTVFVLSSCRVRKPGWSVVGFMTTVVQCFQSCLEL